MKPYVKYLIDMPDQGKLWTFTGRCIWRYSMNGHMMLISIFSPTSSTLPCPDLLPCLLPSTFAQHAYTVNSHTWIARHRTFGQFTMETILAVVFSHRVGILRGDEDQFTRLSQCILRDGQAAAYFGGGDCSVPVFLSNFPFLECFVRMYHSCSEAGKSSKMLTDNIIELIKARRAETGQVTYTCTCVPYYIHMLQCCLGPFVGQG